MTDLHTHTDICIHTCICVCVCVCELQLMQQNAKIQYYEFVGNLMLSSTQRISNSGPVELLLPLRGRLCVPASLSISMFRQG
jgi:hypothetical protein